jgi:hypothetical protein
VRAVLHPPERGEAQGPEGYCFDPGRAKTRQTFAGKARRPERVVEDENPDARRGALEQDAAERVGHLSGLPVVVLDDDGLPSGAKVVPEAPEGAVSVQRELDPVAAGEHGAGQQCHAGRELRLGGGDRIPVGSDAAHVPYGGAPHDEEETDEGEEDEERVSRPARRPSEVLQCRPPGHASDLLRELGRRLSSNGILPRSPLDSTLELGPRFASLGRNAGWSLWRSAR